MLVCRLTCARVHVLWCRGTTTTVMSWSLPGRNKVYLKTDMTLQPTDRTEPREKSSKPVSRNRQRVCVYTRAYATWPRALVCVCGYLPVCVPVRHGAPCSANKETLTVLLASTSVPHPPLCHHLLSLPRSHRPAEALLRTRFSVPLSTNATATKEGATLQQAVS